MTLPGVTAVPPEFAARYRARGYWEDRPLIAHFLDVFAAQPSSSSPAEPPGSRSSSPRTHNDYAFNSKMAASVCDVRDGDVLLDVLPIEHNLPLACPGLQGFLLRGATVCLAATTRAPQVFALAGQRT